MSNLSVAPQPVSDEAFCVDESPAPQPTPLDCATTDVVVDEVSIDGMCGVY